MKEPSIKQQAINWNEANSPFQQGLLIIIPISLPKFSKAKPTNPLLAWFVGDWTVNIIIERRLSSQDLHN
jgi:hypothetical protein